MKDMLLGLGCAPQHREYSKQSKQDNKSPTQGGHAAGKLCEIKTSGIYNPVYIPQQFLWGCSSAEELVSAHSTLTDGLRYIPTGWEGELELGKGLMFSHRTWCFL